MEEGVIKYKQNWQKEKLDIDFNFKEIIEYRQKCFQNNWIGFDENLQVGFGNISQKFEGNQFIISGSQTGHLPILRTNDFSLVNQFNIAKNELTCVGLAKASSESLTHSGIYQLSNKINVVLHIHNNKMWQQHINKLPTSNENVPYGTPAMAYEFQKLFNEGTINEVGILIMGGHQDGIISWANSFKAAFEILQGYERK